MLGKGENPGLGGNLPQLGAHHGVILPVDEGIARGEVLEDAELGVDIVLHLVVVAVEVVGRDVEQHGDVGLERIHIVELERAQLNHVDGMRVAGDLKGEAVADVAGQASVDTRTAQDVIDERGGGRLAVAAGDADHLGIGVAARELDFAYNGNVFLAQGLDDRSGVGNTGALHHLVGGKDTLHGVLAVFVRDVLFFECGEIFGSYRSEIAEKHVHALVFCKNGSADAAFAAAEYHKTFLILIFAHLCLI